MYYVIIGVDPGPISIAWVALTAEGHIKSFGELPINQFIADLSPLEDHKPLASRCYDARMMAVEMPLGHAMITPARAGIKEGDMIRSAAPSRDLFTTARNVGRIEEACLRRNNPLPVHLYSRSTIRGHLDAKNDTTVRAALRDRYCTCGSKGACKKGCALHGMSNDVRAALAVATAVYERPSLKQWGM